MSNHFFVDPDIKKASTLPSSFYQEEKVFENMKEKIFLKSWQFVGDEKLAGIAKSVHPFVFLDKFMTEPLVLTRDEEDQLHCMTNVCTHRANLVVLGSGKQKKLTCMYHGRRFDLKGRFEYMPEFKDAENFPRECDHLREFPLVKWGPLLFTGLNPAFDFKEVIYTMKERIGFLPINEFKLDNSLSRDYLVQAHWALYCDNYLEGFHVPFVHEGLNQVLDYGSYSTEIYKYCNLQIGYADDASDVFELPKDHIDYGKNVAAYYYWVFPNMMFNFYPWGLSINVVKPLTRERTKVSFISYVYDPEKLEKGAGQDLDKVEREDEFVVENVQQGMLSSFYKAGRFSPSKEKGVHHFHRLLADFMNL
ncbi:aromatic ring-hydroxylating dioxygenase subunit alpha [Lutimonas saemankumensis]|uniref:aromatic ring-hydroxylating oxygenase subunit alpha n=1 Tax=Lutimonas saemankumensis TaxID=483016 RepID=UPI001CD37C14|nr:aromatic ring-hydroxylating dioxygenase subunit alpha [Lutimonas saemankumensis]MCA0930965.1 aromatic ring-hydroxylating dioxygenase subunit alpha [Lutimonas saemankumensis]